MFAGIHRRLSMNHAFQYSHLWADRFHAEAKLARDSLEPIVYGGSDAMSLGPKFLEVASAFILQRNLNCDGRSLATPHVEKERPSDHMGSERASHPSIPPELSLAAVPEKLLDERVSHLEHSNPAEIPHDYKPSYRQLSRIWPRSRIMGT